MHRKLSLFHFYFLSPKKKKRKKKKATNYGKSLVASSLTCPLKIPCQRNGHQSLHSGFNIDCLGEKVLRLRLVVVVESTPQLEQAAWRGEVGESGRGGRRGRARVVTRTTNAGFLNWETNLCCKLLRHRHHHALPAIIRGVPPHWVNEPHQELAPALMVVVAGSFLPPTPPRAPPSQVAGLTSSQLRVWWDLLIGFNFSTSFLSSLPAVVLFLLLHLRLHHHHHPSVHHVLSVLVHPHRSL